MVQAQVKETPEGKHSQRLLKIVDLQKISSPLKTHSEETVTLLSDITEQTLYVKPLS